MRISSFLKPSTYSKYLGRNVQAKEPSIAPGEIETNEQDKTTSTKLIEPLRNSYPISSLGIIPTVRINDSQDLTLTDENGLLLEQDTLNFEALSRKIFGAHKHYSLIDSTISDTVQRLKRHAIRQIGYLDSTYFLENGFNSIDFDYINEFKTEEERREARLKLFGNSSDVGRFKRYLQVYAYKVACAARLLCRQEAFRLLKMSKVNERDLVTYSMTQTGSYGINGDHPFSKARKLALVAPPFLVTWLMDGQLSYCLLLSSFGNNSSLTTEQSEVKGELISLQEWFGNTLDERANNAKKIEALLMLYGKPPHENFDDVKPPYIGELVTIYADRFPNRLSLLLSKLQDEVYDFCVSTIVQRHNKFERFPNENMQGPLKDPDFQTDKNTPEDKSSALNRNAISTVEYKDQEEDIADVDTGSYEQPIDPSSPWQATTPEEVLDRAFKYALDLAKKAFEEECEIVTKQEQELIEKLEEENTKKAEEENLKQKARTSIRRTWIVGLGSALVLATIGGKLAYDRKESAYFDSKVKGMEAKLSPYSSLSYRELQEEALRVLNSAGYPKEPVDYLEIRKWDFEQVVVRANFTKALNERYFRRLAVLFSPELTIQNQDDIRSGRIQGLPSDFMEKIPPHLRHFGLCTKDEWEKDIRFFVGDHALSTEFPNSKGLGLLFLLPVSKYYRAPKDPMKRTNIPEDYTLVVRELTEQEGIRQLLKQFDPKKEPTEGEIQPKNYINRDPNYLSVRRAHTLMLDRISTKVKTLLAPYERLNALSSELQGAKNEGDIDKVETLERELNSLHIDLQSRPSPAEVRPLLENLVLGEVILLELQIKIDERVKQIKSNNSYFANQIESR